MTPVGSPAPTVAVCNTAYAVVHEERPELWRDLFHTDDFHPSRLGTYLMASVVFLDWT